MGYNTACIILNDTLHEFAKDAAIGAKVKTAILTAGLRSGAYGPHGFKALPSQHADNVQIVAVGGNSIRLLGFGHWQDTPEQILRKLADDHGFRLVRKSQPRRMTPLSQDQDKSS